MLNSSSVMTDSAGVVAQTLDYYPFGEIRIDTKPAGSTFNEQRKYIGQEYDQDTGLNYLNARYYNSVIGRFISADPVYLAIGDSNQVKQIIGKDQIEFLTNPQTLNPYSYANNNPIILSDPKGLSGDLTIHAIGGPFITDGHAWITYLQDGSKNLISYGTWGNNPNNRGDGLIKNEELNRGLFGDASRQIHINDDQEKYLLTTIQQYEGKGNAGWTPTSPCSAFAQDAWYAGTGEYLKANAFIFINNPGTLKNSIIKANSGEKHNTVQQEESKKSSSSSNSADSLINSSSYSGGRSSRTGGSSANSFVDSYLGRKIK